MTRFVHDQFSKDYLEELLTPLGEVKIPRRVAAEVQEIDIGFIPRFPLPAQASELGLLGRFAEFNSVFEPFRNAVTPTEICDCLLKVLLVHTEYRREQTRNNQPLDENNLARLWILSPTLSQRIIRGFNLVPDGENWGTGVYFLGDFLKTAIVAIHQLPETPDTLWLRMLGGGTVQEKAIDEFEALPPDFPLKLRVEPWLQRLRSNLAIRQDLENDDRRLIMRLLPLYDQELAEKTQQAQEQGIQQGIQQGIESERRTTLENLFKARFGELDEQLQDIIPLIVHLSSEEYSAFLLQLFNLSREDLLSRFS